MNSSSYKFGFFKSILDNLNYIDKDYTLSFDLLFSRFAQLYWNLVVNYGLQQGPSIIDNRKTLIEKTLIEAKNQFKIKDNLSFEELPLDLQKDICIKAKNRCKKYVVGALYEDTQKVFYSFSKKEEWIRLNPKVYRFIQKNKNEIEKLNNYEWAHFLEKGK